MVLIFFALILSLPSISLFLLQDVRKQEWTAIIPNSQLIVIPYPQNDPRRYIHIYSSFFMEKCTQQSDKQYYKQV